jgi:hypothetical protein
MKKVKFMNSASRVLVLVAFALIFPIYSAAAQAADRPGYEESYGMAGCGLGSIAAKEFSWDNGFVQISAATTNGTYGNQTISMTIGISNCDDGLFTKHLQAEQEVFVGANLAQLSKDVARGEGEYVLAFADLLGCSESIDSTAKFVAVGRESHAAIFESGLPEVVLARYKDVLAQVKLTCTRT